MLSTLDYCILIGTLGIIVGYGIWRTRSTKTMDGYLKGDNTSPWWSVGLGIMATQASAITFLSTPGQAYNDGLRFIQFYFGLPLAMIVLCITAVPLYSKLKVFTAYQYLEDRFGLPTRTLASGLFLLQRGLSTGITIYAPSIVLSTVLGWSLNATILFIGLAVTAYTIIGGNKAVSVTHQQQMLVIFTGLFAAVVVILQLLPPDVGIVRATQLAGYAGKLNAIDWSWDLKERYNIWSGLIGGFFLQLSYFGTDQSQVGRYIGGANVTESRLGLIMNGLVKIPMQLLILFIGIMVYVFYLFHPAPLNFNSQAESQVYASASGPAYQALERQYLGLQTQKANKTKVLNEAISAEDPKQILAAQRGLDDIQQQITQVRSNGQTIIKTVSPKTDGKDADYIFIHFVLRYLPHGLIGLLLAVILSAAMSSTSAALTSLGGTTVIDLYQRMVNPDASGNKMVFVSRLSTAAWGIIAMGFALVASLVDNLIQAVNILGSLFYGCILGIFLVGFYVPFVKGKAVFVGAIVAELVVLFCFWKVESIGYLWYNVIGCLLVIMVGLLVQALLRQPKAAN